MQAQRGQPRPTSAAGINLLHRPQRQSPETVETRDLSFPILRLLDLVLASANRFGAAPATGGKAGPQARPHAVGLDPGEDAACSRRGSLLMPPAPAGRWSARVGR